MKNKNFLSEKGEVIKLLRGNIFRIKCDNGQILNASVAARFRTPTGGRRANLVIGDRVKLEIPVADLEKGQIIALDQKR